MGPVEKTGAPVSTTASILRTRLLAGSSRESQTLARSCLSPFVSDERIDTPRILSCFLIHTSGACTISCEANIDRSPLFNGQISGIGPRYAAIALDKGDPIPRQRTPPVFLEPGRGLDAEELVNGLSMKTSRRRPAGDRPGAAGSPGAVAPAGLCSHDRLHQPCGEPGVIGGDR